MAAPPMTPEKAKLILKDAIQLFTVPENKAKLAEAVAAAMQLPPDQQGMARARRRRRARARGARRVRAPQAKMTTIVPLVTAMVGPKLQEHGLPNVMMGVMQIQMVGQQDPLVAEGVKILTGATMGNPPGDDVIAAYLAKI